MKLVRVACVPTAYLLACGQLDNAPDAAVDASLESAPPDDHPQVSDVSAEASLDAVDVVDSTLNADGGACVYAKPSLYYCNGLVPAGPIKVTCGLAPSAIGGVIADGHYELTAAMWDTATFDATCPTSLSRAGAIEVCAGNLLWLDVDENNSAFDGSMIYSTSGNELTVNPYCSGAAASYEYTATGSTLALRIGTSAVLVLTYTLNTTDM